MKRNLFLIMVLAAVVAMIAFVPSDFFAQEPGNCPPDKELCAKMLRFGKQSYIRGKYLDAKAYFRQAIQADPASALAWQYYDQSVIFALAEKVEKNAQLILPDVSTRGESVAAPPAAATTQTAVTPPAPPAAPAPPKPEASKPEKKFKFKIVDDEGC